MAQKPVTTEDLQKTHPHLFVQSTSRTAEGVLMSDSKTAVPEKTAAEQVASVKTAHESGLQKEPVATPEKVSKS